MDPDNEFEEAALQYFKDSIRTMTNINAALPEILGKVAASDVMTRTLASELDSLRTTVTKRDDRTRVICLHIGFELVLEFGYNCRTYLTT